MQIKDEQRATVFDDAWLEQNESPLSDFAFFD